MSEPVLEIDSVTKAFGGFHAVEDLSLSLDHGELRGLIGSNGAGKSTLLHLIYGRLAPDRGAIRFGGTEVTSMPARDRARLGMGLVFQVTSVFEELTVQENLTLGAMPKTTTGVDGPDLETAVDEMLELVELGGVRHRAAGHLSHGEQQWLEIAMVLLCRPELVLLDEPTSGMTRAESRRTADLLRRLQADRVTDAMVVVEHNIEFIRLVSDRVTVMHRGQVLADGTIDEVGSDADVQAAYLGRLR